MQLDYLLKNLSLFKMEQIQYHIYTITQNQIFLALSKVTARPQTNTLFIPHKHHSDQ